ncbi:MAG: hypothetical protein GY855_09510, partial [candidate division Zixibacteria bacterium]|nr:hypothetical protein [candidate division Zixibacteria bacterium]
MDTVRNRGYLKFIVWIIVCVMLMVAVSLVMPSAETNQQEPDLNVEVTSFTPIGITKPKTNITIEFSRELVPDDNLNNPFTDIPVRFEPPIPGIARWLDNHVLRIFPGSPLTPSTEYIAYIESDKSYLYRNRIKKSHDFKFRTPIFTIKSFRTEIINVSEPPFHSRILFHLSFNYPVDQQELKKFMSTNLKVEGGTIKLDIKEKPVSSSITVISEPFKSQKSHGKFLFKINKGLPCVDGQIPLPSPFEREFRIPEPKPLVINRVTSRGAGPNCQLLIELSQAVALDQIKEYLSITPEEDYTVDQRYRRIVMLGNFRPRETYTVNIKKGLISLNGQTLERDFSSKVQIGDLPPSMKFLDNAIYMPPNSSKLVAIETVNINQISIEVEQIFPNNIVYYLGSGNRRNYRRDVSRVGRRLFTEDFGLESEPNKPLTSTFDIGGIVGDTLQGIYKVSARIKERRWTYAERNVMITDLGILTRLSSDYLMVWINSLSGTGPVSKVEVSLISSNNQLLLKGKTNSKGVVIFDDIADKITDFEPFVITAVKGDDLSYLKFNECLIPTSDFDAKGRPYLSRGYEAFIYTDRGIYRPGEDVHLLSVIRGVNSSMPPEFPYILEIKDPQGGSLKDYKLTTAENAISELSVTIPSFAKTGKYLAKAKIGEDVIGFYEFQVEEFIPDRIKTELSTDKDIYDAGDKMNIIVDGVYLFGPPCAGNDVRGHLTMQTDNFRPNGWSGYSFVNPEMKFSSIEVDLATEQLDEKGRYIYEYKIPDNLKPPSSLKMLLSATILEEGGRAVSDFKVAKINPYPIYLGVKSNFKGYAKIGEDLNFSITALNKSGSLVAVDSVWVKFYRVIYQNIIKKDATGLYRYASEKSERIIDSTLVEFYDKPVSAIFTPQDYGSFSVKVFSCRTGHSSSVGFYVSGWGYSPWSMANPDRIELELDRRKYNSGDEAKLLVKAPFSGRLLLTVEKDKVLKFETYDLDSNTAEIKLPVKKEYQPNVYITATLIKSTNSLERFSPPRAFGIIPLLLVNSGSKLNMSIESPEATRPKEKLEVKIKTRPNTILTVAAVDAGILQLTDFTLPDPFEYFYGKKRPSLRAYDIYSLIYPDIQAEKSHLNPPGGKAFDRRRMRHLNPLSVRRIVPVALWSGIVTTDSLGSALVEFDLPQFNGRLDIMAVGFNDNQCGSASREVAVRDKIVIQESLPRFVAPGDKVNARALIFNNTGEDGNFEITMKIDGSASIESSKNVSLFIPDNGKVTAKFLLQADSRPGKISISISASKGKEKSSVNMVLPNRPGQPLLTLHGSGTVKENQPAKISIPDDWLEGTAEYNFKVSSLPAVRLTRSIQYLLSYPYGCLEQITSRLFPLLYFNDIAGFVQPAIFGTKGQDYFIEEGILRIQGMQASSGGFNMWPGKDIRNDWSSIYAAHFLIEARKSGYQVDDDVYKKMLKYLKKQARHKGLTTDHLIIRIYNAYVLAKAGKLDKSIVNNIRMHNLDSLPLYSRFQLAGAIAMTTGIEDALWLMPSSIHPRQISPETGRFFSSSLKSNAILLDILSEITPDNPAVPELVKAISEDLYVGRWYTTQSNAWALMALGKFFKTQEDPDYEGVIFVEGKEYKNFDIQDINIYDSTLGGKDIRISIQGTGNCYYYWQGSGVSTSGVAREFDNSLRVRR